MIYFFRQFSVQLSTEIQMFAAGYFSLESQGYFQYFLIYK